MKLIDLMGLSTQDTGYKPSSTFWMPGAFQATRMSLKTGGFIAGSWFGKELERLERRRSVQEGSKTLSNDSNGCIQLSDDSLSGLLFT